jgi:hypothetical protein
MRRGELMPWLETLIPLLFMGKGGGKVPRIELPPSLGRSFEMFTGDPFTPPTAVPKELPELPVRSTPQRGKIFPEVPGPGEPDLESWTPDLSPSETERNYNLFYRGLLPGQFGKTPLITGPLPPAEQNALSPPVDWGNIYERKYSSPLSPENYRGLFSTDLEVNPPYQGQSPIRITPEEIQDVPTPPGINIVPQTPPKPQAPGDDTHWWYRQPEPPYLSEVVPQMPFYPETDWYRQMWQSQIWPGDLDWRIA